LSLDNLAAIKFCLLDNTIYVNSFEGENFCGSHGFLLTMNIIPLKVFLEYRHHPLTTQSMVLCRVINNEQSIEMLCGTWPTMLPLFKAATTHQPLGFPSSLSPTSCSPITGIQHT